MGESQTTVAVQRYLDELAVAGHDESTETVVRSLLARSAARLERVCGSFLYRSYPRLTHGPTNLHPEEVLSGVIERLLKAMREVRPQNVRQFFALANRHILWELNEVARQLDQNAPAQPLQDFIALPTPPSGISGTGDAVKLRRILSAIDELPEDEKEVLNLVRLQGMTKSEASAVLGVSEKTVQRRLRRSLTLLSDALGDLLGESSPTTEPGIRI